MEPAVCRERDVVLVNLMAVEPQFGGGQQLVLWNAAKVEQEAKGHQLAIVALVNLLHVLCKSQETGCDQDCLDQEFET